MSKNKFNTIMCVIWSIVAICCGFYAVMNGGAYGADESLSDPSIEYIAASFGIPGIISIFFGFCQTWKDVKELVQATKEIVK